VATLSAPSLARAQACCAGASALSPGRLALHEDALAGVLLHATDIYGSFDTRRTFVSPNGARELDFEQDLLATLRVAHKGQLGILFPIDETWRSATGASEAGGGVGDFQAALRWDFIDPGSYVVWPGVAVSLGVTLPTGRAPEDASNQLGTDATGTGSFQGAFAIALEQTYGHVLVNLTGSAALRSAHATQGVYEQLGPLFSIFGAAGYALDSGAAVAFTAAYTADLDATINGAVVSHSSRAFTRLSIAGGSPLGDTLRMQGSIFSDVPIAGFGNNQPLGFGLTWMLLRVWS
jgi:hypothetical protein